MESSMSHLFSVLNAGFSADVKNTLKEFNIKHENSFKGIGLTKENYHKLWKLIIEVIENSHNEEIYINCFNTLRILSRDKALLNEVVEKKHVNIIVKFCGLVSQQDLLHNLNINSDVMFEASRCLSNMLYNSKIVQQSCTSNDCLPGLMWRLQLFHDEEILSKQKSLNLRLVFLMTALCPDIRQLLITKYDALNYLFAILDHFITEKNSTQPIELNSENCSIVIDTLKTLYNLVICIKRSDPSENESEFCLKLICVLKIFLLSKSSTDLLTCDLHSNTVNLLLITPPKLYSNLIDPMSAFSSKENFSSKRDQNVSQENGNSFQGKIFEKETNFDELVEYDGYEMSAIVNLINFLEVKLNEKKSAEHLTPVLTFLVELTQNVRLIRKFLRLKVLPPLRDVSRRPEDGNTLRNKLCALMTSPNSDLSYLSASFLFVLCKENVNRLIKYTGYGNAAGLLASRGLLAGNSAENSGNFNYSDDSDSGTEEYENCKEKINPVTGYCEPTRPSPLQNMTDEQKEHEAMKLVEALDKMTRSSNNLIRPCCIGEDGQPRPVEHVLQLQEMLLDDNNRNNSNNNVQNDDDGSEN